MLVKSKYTFQTNDKDDNILLCNLLYNTKCMILKDDINTLKVYNSPNKYRNTDSIEPFLSAKLFVEDSVNENEKVLSSIEEAMAKRSKTLNITIKPTIGCNLACIYCWQKDEQGIMSDESIDKLIKFIDNKAKDSEKILINWFGGEPMLQYDSIIKVMDSIGAISRKYKIPYIGIMSTNGTLLTPAKLENLLRHHVYSYQITIDGIKEYHDKTRPAKNANVSSYDTIVTNLKSIRDTIKKKYLEIIIRVNITEQFVECMDDFIKFYKEEFSSDKRFSLLFEEVNDNGGERIKSYKNDILVKSITRDELVDYLLSEDIIQHNFMNYEHGNMMCNSLINNSYNVNYDGVVYMCELLSDKRNSNKNNTLGQIDDNGNLIENKDVIDYWRNDVVKEFCNDCLLYPLCSGGLCPLNIKNSKNCHYKNHMYTINNSLRMLSKEKRLPIISLNKEVL